jgi:carbonic anhydrase
MTVLKKILKNNEAWAAEKLKSDAGYFEQLSKGQSPDVLYIGCSDSRVTAEEMMGAGPGDLFVHRNIANVIPNTDINAMSVINYAVEHLKVKHIVVCGHYECGGVNAAMQPKNLGILNPWLRNIRDVFRTHRQELNAIQDDGKKNDRLVELNVEEQCLNVLKTPEVQLAYKSGDLSIDGWVFDIRSGRIIDLAIDFAEKIESIREIYRLS